MSMRAAVIVALVGASIQTLVLLTTLMGAEYWYGPMFLTVGVLASGTQVLFFAVLLSKQKGAIQ